jgi:hypothetical protein
MRIKTDGKHDYRTDQLRRIMQATDEGTKSGAFDFSTECGFNPRFESLP